MNDGCRFLPACLLLCAALAATAAPALEEIVQEDYAVTGDVRLTIHNAEGTVHIYGTNEPGIKMTAIKKAYSKARLEAIKVQVTNRGNTLVVETVFPPKPKGLSLADRSGTVDYTFIVPQTAALAQLTIENGELIVDGLRGENVNIRLTNGRMLVQNCFSRTELVIGRGATDVIFDWWEPTSFELSSAITNGDINLKLPREAAVRLDAASSKGMVESSFAGAAAEHTSESRSLHLSTGADPTALLKLRVDDGSIRIRNRY